MLYWIAEQLGFPGILNLVRYLSFRTGGAVATALIIGLIIGPKFIGWLRVRQGKGQPIRSDGPQTHLAKVGTPTMGGLMILTSLTLVDPAVDGPEQSVRVGGAVRDARVRGDRVPRRLGQGQEGQPQGRVGADAAAARVPDRGARRAG